MYNYNCVFQTTLGKDVEDAMCRMAVVAIKKNNYKINKFRKVTGTKEDLFEGTDAIWNGARIDFTYNFSNKNNMKVLKNYVPFEVDGRTIQLKAGYRTGNSYKGFTKFKIPVLVIGFDCDDNRWFDDHFNDVFNAFEKRYFNIIRDARNLYCKQLKADGII